MAEKSGFFDAHASVDAEGRVVYDRTYLAESFAKYFASFIGNGVFGGKSNELMVRQRADADMSVVAHSGLGWINGYWYENDDELSLAIDVADGILNRIDIVVLRWDNSARGMQIRIKKGTFASNPLAPIVQRDADIYELKLAEVYVKAGATKITQADITDTRLDSDVCGFVVGIIEQFDTAEFNAQLNAWIETFKLESVEEVNNLLVQVEAILQASDLGPLIVDIQNLKDLSTKSKVAANNLNEVVTIGFYSMPGEKAVNHPTKIRYSHFGTLLVEHRNEDIVHQTVRRENYIAVRYSADNGTTWSEWEYVNPMFEVDVEYRTTERHQGVAVFKKVDANGNILWRKQGESQWLLFSPASYVSPATVE